MNQKPVPCMLVVVLAAIWGASAGAVLGAVYMVVARPDALGIFMAGSGPAGLLIIPLYGAIIGSVIAAVLALGIYRVATHRPPN
ncbi:MAG TPA: hypothetical protein VJK02_08665 [Anaerolineales bacterium]|nr:hypothetical protein [Anaerolineales bacterium]